MNRNILIVFFLIVAVFLSGYVFFYKYNAKQINNNGNIYIDKNIVWSDNDFSNDVSTTSHIVNNQQDGNTLDYSQYNVDDADTEVIDDNTQGEFKWVLKSITKDPVVNYWVNDDDITFVGKKDGSITTYNINSGTIHKIANPFVKNILSASIMDTGVYILFSNSGETFIVNKDGKIVKSKMDIDKDVAYFIQGKPVDSDIFYIIKNKLGIDLINFKWDKSIFKSVLRSFNIDVISDYFVLTTSPSYNINGYAYLLPKTGTKDGIGGLIPLKHGGKALSVKVSNGLSKMIYSTVDDVGLHTYFTNLKTGKGIKLKISTLAEKCYWDNEIIAYCAVPIDVVSFEELPDRWYTGEVHFDDKLIRINFDTGDVFDILKESKLDIVMPKKYKDTIVFKNKKDGSLWGVFLQKVK